MAGETVSIQSSLPLSVYVYGLTVIEGHDTTGTGELLDELDALGVVFGLDGLLAGERLVRGGAAPVLEAGGGERHRVFLAAQVLDLHGVRLGCPVHARYGGGGVVVGHGVRLGAVLRRSEVHEERVHGLRFRRHAEVRAGSVGRICWDGRTANAGSGSSPSTQYIC